MSHNTNKTLAYSLMTGSATELCKFQQMHKKDKDSDRNGM